MSGTISTVAITIDGSGIHGPAYADILNYLQTQFRNIYGQDTYLENDSQDGQWIGIVAKAYADTNNAVIAMFNSFRPADAQGAGLSSVVKINGIAREISTNGQVDLTVEGDVGLTIINGIASDITNNRWLLPPMIVIPPTGTIIVTAIAEKPGAVQAPPNSVNRIATPTRGWNTVNNIAAATPGAPIETDAMLVRRQASSTALPSRAIMDGITGAIAAITGVLRLRGYENDGDLIDSNGLSPHSIAYVVEGGDDVAIANTIAIKKAPGTQTIGTTNITVTNTYGNPIIIKYYRPALVPISGTLLVKAKLGYTTNMGNEIVAAIVTQINTGLSIGDTVFINSLYVQAFLGGKGDAQFFNITGILLARNAGTKVANDVVIAYNEVAIAQISDFTVTVS